MPRSREGKPHLSRLRSQNLADTSWQWLRLTMRVAAHPWYRIVTSAHVLPPSVYNVLHCATSASISRR